MLQGGGGGGFTCGFFGRDTSLHSPCKSPTAHHPSPVSQCGAVFSGIQGLHWFVLVWSDLKQMKTSNTRASHIASDGSSPSPFSLHFGFARPRAISHSPQVALYSLFPPLRRRRAFSHSRPVVRPFVPNGPPASPRRQKREHCAAPLVLVCSPMALQVRPKCCGRDVDVEAHGAADGSLDGVAVLHVVLGQFQKNRFFQKIYFFMNLCIE